MVHANENFKMPILKSIPIYVLPATGKIFELKCF